jgi:TetR/AcrR family transcriptional repressor of nem operon
MRYSKDHKAETHLRIVEKASERFRAEGIDNVGIASLMQSIGLTVGGFYAHFGSKDDLIAEACAHGFAETNERFRRYVETRQPGRQLTSLVDAYLSKQHCDQPEAGCFAAANGPEIARQSEQARVAYAAQVKAWIGLIERAMESDGLQGNACAVAGILVGCLTLARSMKGDDAADAFLEAGRAAAMASVRPRAA